MKVKRSSTELLLGLAVALVTGACQSTSTVPTLTAAEVAAAREALFRPLPGDLSALYRLRVPSSGGLRMSVATVGRSGVLSVSEPFGSLLTTTAWDGPTSRGVIDLRRGCTIERGGLEEMLGVGALPLEQAAHLLGGRLPAVEGDVVRVLGGGRLAIEGDGWATEVELASEPWRLVKLSDEPPSGEARWHIDLSDHTASVPGTIRFEHRDGRWAELTLVRLQWDQVKALPTLPSRPPCGSALEVDDGGD